MKKLINHFRAIIVIAMMLCVALPTLAHDFEVNGIYYNYLDKTKKIVEVTYKGENYNAIMNHYRDAITIPSSVTYNGTTSSVTSIGAYAFYNCYGLTSVTIPNSVTSIDESAFKACRGLTEVNYNAENCTSMGSSDYSVFSICSNLKTLNIGNEVKNIPAYAFSNCSGLTEVTIPNSVISIGKGAFEGTGWYNNQPNGILYLGNFCLGYKGSKPTGVLSLKDETRSIGDYAFYNCTGLTSITIPNSVTSIGYEAFYDCDRLTSVTIPNSVTSIGESAFEGTGWYDNQPKGVIYINNVLYKYKGSMSSGASISIKDGTVSISGGAFYDCSGLTSVTIPNSVTTIGSFAFAGCTGLTSITIPNSVTSIGEYAFYGCSGLTTVTIPNSVTSIGDVAFTDCSGLTEVNYNAENCTSMGSSSFPVFSNCSNLKTVNIGSSVKTIPYHAFAGCTGLILVNYNAENCSSMDFAFNTCSNLKTVNIGSSVKTIPDYAFAGCTGLTSITIPNSVTTIGASTFYNCTGLTSVYGGEKIETVKDNAFWGCDNLVNCNSIASNYLTVDLALSTPTQYTPMVNYNNEIYLPQNGTITINNLTQNSKYQATIGFKINNSACEIKSLSFHTKEYILGINGEVGSTSIKASGYYPDCEITVEETGISFGNQVGEYNDLDMIIVNNLDPRTSYTIYYEVNTKESGVFSTSQKFTTESLTWENGEYTATSTSSVRLSVESNCDATEGTGYEWKRSDAPESLAPSKAPCPVVDGKLIGSLRGLNSNAYYNCRPYYTSSSGKIYYGKWFTVFSGDANVYFEPEVSTSDKNTVVDNSAIINGYALAGSDDILEQGFEYWKTSTSPATYSSSGVMIAKASGISMSATITNLEYNSTYKYRAFATTEKGTIYGKEVEFNTGNDPSGVEYIDSNVIVAVEVARYDIHGRLLNEPTRGINIVIYSDGTTRKEIVK